MRPNRLPSLLLLALVAPPVAWGQELPPAAQDTGYTPGAYRVFTGGGEPAALDDIVTAMGRHAVVFIGEAHDDPTGHMLEAELLRRAHETYGPTGASNGREERPVVLSLEFFQRDVQLVLDEYLAGLIPERTFLAESRPWPRYRTDYHPLIEYARLHGLPVIAANAPRRYVTLVSRRGRVALDELDPGAAEWLPPLPYGEPSEAYRDQWIGIITDVMRQEGTKCGRPIPEPEAGEEPVHAQAPPGSHDLMGNQLDGQVLWDATMAHSIADRLAAQPDALVLHMVGAFHVARGTGIPEQLAAYRPDAAWMTVLLRPVDDVESFRPAPDGEWADFVVQTDAERTLERIDCRAYLAEPEGR